MKSVAQVSFLLFALRLGMSSLQFFVETQSDCQKLTASKAHSMTVVELARLDSYSGRAELKAQQVRSKSYSSTVALAPGNLKKLCVTKCRGAGNMGPIKYGVRGPVPTIAKSAKLCHSLNLISGSRWPKAVAKSCGLL